MASDFTPLEQHVEAIKATLQTGEGNDRVDIRVGELSLHADGPPRRILFEPLAGGLGEPLVTGKIEIFTGRWSRPLKSVPLRVLAHIVAESHTALWVLWNNLVIASEDSLKSFSTPGQFNLNPDPRGMASNLAAGARYMTQEFTWTFHLFDRIAPLPGYARDVTLVQTGELVQPTGFTNVQDLLDPDEENP